jgi:hypothetical protein
MTEEAKTLAGKLATAGGQAGAGVVLLALLIGLLRPTKPADYVRLDLREWRCIEARAEGSGRVCDTWTRNRATKGTVR